MSRPSAAIAEKRQRLKEIVERLGPEATPAEIREEAYKTGFGAVNGHMLIRVRNDLWPDRPKHRGGYAPDAPETTLIVAQSSVVKLLVCPACSSPRIRVQECYTRKDGTIRRQRLCKVCGHVFVTEGPKSEQQTHPRRRLARLAINKECSTCKKILPVSRFGKKLSDPDLYYSSCRECLARKRHEHGRKRTLARYGMTLEEYNVLLAEQGGRCAICRSSHPGGGNRKGRARRTFCLDHCHRTGKVRGLLCNRCNLGLGNFDDDVDTLEAARSYVHRHREQRKEVTHG